MNILRSHSIVILQFSSIHWTECREIPNSFINPGCYAMFTFTERGRGTTGQLVSQIHQVDDLLVNGLFFYRPSDHNFFLLNLQKKKPTDNRLNSPWRSKFKTSRLWNRSLTQSYRVGWKPNNVYKWPSFNLLDAKATIWAFTLKVVSIFNNR